MKAIRFPLRKVATVSALLTLVVFAAILLLQGTESSVVLKLVAKSGVAFTVAGVFWEVYNRWAWRVAPFKYLKWLSPYPDLNGRWIGTVIRKEAGDAERPFVIEITQTFTSIAFSTFSTHSRGGSTGAWLMSNEDATTWGVAAVWHATTRRRDEPDQEEVFPGTSVWRLEFVDEPGLFQDKLKIVDDYYTARSPATSGRIEVRRVSRTLKNGFADGK
ncbi:Cap15 family cyclic dinucleotide receptor domain-containing protein [Nocardioides ungokensis]|uniref:Cap15 family cyclic dinucleotide receptor domain-containing protein n=1 Tax=Nocardioides ungokensis TaxID=1643322 RepID=UPI0015DDEBAC|nr:hypothetical protein [Nocardioides ungokensis]